jgi:outer membrane protein TolC
MSKIYSLLTCLFAIFFSATAFSQGKSPDSVLTSASLSDCIQYALKNQPLVRQSLIDEEITETTIKTKLADWYPQIGLTYGITHYLELPTSFFPNANGVNQPVKIGVKNTSSIQLGVNQAIFNQDLLLANRTVKDVRKQAQQTTVSNKINVIVEVSKAYYDLLLTQKQVAVLDENIVRLERSLKDAFNQYEGGIVDKIDYKRAQIALNNTKADKKRTMELTHAKFADLKQLMGYPGSAEFSIIYDSLQMEKEAITDTLQKVQHNNRIENQLLQTRENLLQANVKYYKWSYLPALSANGIYAPAFQNEKFANLYNNAYPSSYVGLQLTLPIFQGNKRNYNIHNANLQLTRLQWDITAVNNQIDDEYAQALAAYKGALADWNALKENLVLAEDVYNTLRLQYNAGIKTYLDVIIAETDLRSAQLNYLNALYNVLASKLDMQKALGTIPY